MESKTKRKWKMENSCKRFTERSTSEYVHYRMEMLILTTTKNEKLKTICVFK